MAATVFEDPVMCRKFIGHKKDVTSVAFNPNMKQLASCGLDKTILVWDLQHPKIRACRLNGHSDGVLSVDFSSTGNLLASGSYDKTIRLWVPKHTSGESSCLRVHSASVRSVQFSSDSAQILTSSDDKLVKLHDIQRLKFKTSFKGHTNWVRSAKLSNDDRMIVSGSDDRTVKLWDVDNSALIHTFYESTSVINQVAFHPDGTCVAAACADGTTKLWDTRTKKLLQHYSTHDDAVTSLSFHPSGNFLLTGSADATSRILNLKEGYLFYTVQGQKGPVLDVAFSICGRQFASAGQDSTILLWDTKFDKSFRTSGIPQSISGSEYTNNNSPVHRHRTRHHVQSKLSSNNNRYTYQTSGPSVPSKHHSIAQDACSTRHKQRKNSTLSGQSKQASTSQPSSRHTQSLKPVSFSPQRASRSDESTRNKTVTSSLIHPNKTNRHTQNGRHVEYTGPPVPDLTEGEPSIVDLAPALFFENHGDSPSHSPNRETTQAGIPLEPLSMPYATASTLERIVNQVDVLTQTVHIVERRLTMVEDLLSQGNVKQQQTTHSENFQTQNINRDYNSSTSHTNGNRMSYSAIQKGLDEFGIQDGYDVEVRPIHSEVNTAPHISFSPKERNYQQQHQHYPYNQYQPHYTHHNIINDFPNSRAKNLDGAQVEAYGMTPDFSESTTHRRETTHQNGISSSSFQDFMNKDFHDTIQVADNEFAQKLKGDRNFKDESAAAQSRLAAHKHDPFGSIHSAAWRTTFQGDSSAPEPNLTSMHRTTGLTQGQEHGLTQGLQADQDVFAAQDRLLGRSRPAHGINDIISDETQ